MSYPQAFKENMVRRLTGPHAVSAGTLAEEVGVPQSSLSRWLREARTLGPMKKQKEPSKEPRSPREWTPEEKIKALVAADGLSDEELGAFLRREGLHEAQLQQWRETMQAALGNGKPKKRKGSNADTKRIKKLEKELRRKEKALAEVTALLVLQKKVNAYWEEEESGTQKKSDE